MELVSVLIPVYNVENFIEKAVDSILNQSYYNIEVIIVDDFSNDRTYEILQSMKKKDDRIKLFRNSKNSKIVETLNFAFKQSSGEYICRMDGDDISHYQRIEKKLLYLKENPQISLVGCSVQSIDEEGNILSKKKMPSGEKTIRKTLKYANPVFHIWLAKREVYEALNGYRSIPYVEDYDFLLRMTTLGLKYSNLENYYGYSIRLRSGNTISHAGIIQRKAHRYCYELYQQRDKKSEDDFSLENFNSYVQSSTYEKRAFQLSNILLQKALMINKKISISKYSYFIIAYLVSNEQRKYINGRLRVLLYSKFLGGE
jgi:glycosyltransferase involved in cell wall biosynthesis